MSAPQFVMLTKSGTSRVMDSSEGMIFRVKEFTINGVRRIAHVVDDRYDPIAIWSLGPEDYTEESGLSGIWRVNPDNSTEVLIGSEYGADIYYTDECEAERIARFITACASSYGKLPDPLAAAEGDLLGICRDMLIDCLDTFEGETEYLNGCSTRDMVKKIRKVLAGFDGNAKNG